MCSNIFVNISNEKICFTEILKFLDKFKDNRCRLRKTVKFDDIPNFERLEKNICLEKMY